MCDELGLLLVDDAGHLHIESLLGIHPRLIYFILGLPDLVFYGKGHRQNADLAEEGKGWWVDL